MQKITQKMILDIINNDCIVRDYIAVTFKKEPSDEYDTIKVYLSYKQKMVEITITKIKKTGYYMAWWSCEGYIYYITAQHLTEICDKIQFEGNKKPDEE